MNNKRVFWSVFTVLCNKEITFQQAIHIALKLGFSIVPTKDGSYVDLVKDDFIFKMSVKQIDIHLDTFLDLFDYYEKYLENKKGDISF